MSKKSKQSKSGNDEEPPLQAKVLNRLSEGFHKLEKDGKVSLMSLDKLLQYSKEDYDKDDIDDVLVLMNKNKSDSFTFEEYCLFIQKINSPMRIIEAFKIFDKNKDGTLSKDEFRYILTSFNNKIDERDIQEIFDMFDENKDRKLSYDEFVNFWENK